MDRNATECVYAGGKDTEGVEDGPDSAVWKRKGNVQDPRKYQDITLLSKVGTETVGEGFRRKDQEKNSKGSGRGEEQQTG